MICSTIKKGVVGAGLGAMTLGLLFGTSAPSYVKTAFCRVRATAESRVPIEYKIEEARQQVAALEPAIKQNIEALVRAEIDVRDLDREIALTKANLEQEGREMAGLTDGLKNGRFQLTGGSSYTADEVKADLASRLDQYKRTKEILVVKQATVKEKQQHVAAIRKVLHEMGSQKKALEAKIEGIETRLAQIRATQATNEYTFDTTPLSKAKAAIAELDKKLEVMSRTAEYEGQYVEGGVSVPGIEPGRDICTEVEAELNGTATATSADSQPST
jgi:septal ring factor EnvC (AmiA/AmiB activator)